jgi:methyl-accepting chemotaxis protein
MNLLKSFKIHTKLSILIFITTIGIVAVGIVGYYYNSQSKSTIAEMYKENMLPDKILADALVQASANKTNTLELMLTKDISVQSKIFVDIQNKAKLFDDDFAEYEKSDLDRYELDHYAEMKKSLAAWRDIRNKCSDLVKSGKSDEAYALYTSTGIKGFEDFQTDLENLLDYNTQLADRSYINNGIEYNKAITLMIFIIVIVIVICAIVSILITFSITKPLKKTVGFIEKTSRFDLVYDPSIEYLLGYKDETGDMVRALADMRKTLRGIVGDIIAISNNLAEHSVGLTASTEENSKAIGQVVTTINEMAEGNNNQAEMVSKTSETISDVVKTINDVNITTEANANNAAKSLEMVDEGQKTIDIAVEKMNENVRITQKVGLAVNELSEMMGKVGGIVDVITSISGQTNLLALNAAIEAARAGDAGKGFSVVSEEIRKLAEGSSSAAKDISHIIKETIEKIKYTADSMDKARLVVDSQKAAVTVTEEVFTKIKESVKDIAKCTQQSSVMLQDINTKSKDIADQTQDMAAVAEQSAAGTEEVAASGEEQLASIELIAHAAFELSAIAEELNSKIRKFKI